SRPGHLSRERELIEPRGVVAFDAKRKHVTLPCGGWKLESGELLDDRSDARRTFQPIRGMRVLPASEEVEKHADRHGLERAAARIEHEATDPREDAPFAPLDDATDTHAEDVSSAFEREEGGAVSLERPAGFEPSEEDVLRIAARLLGEESIALANDASRARELIDEIAPVLRLLGGHVSHPKERLVHLIGALGTRPDLVANELDDRGIELAGRIERGLPSPSARGRRLAP